MADTPIIRIDNTDYNVKDAQARAGVTELKSAIAYNTGSTPIEFETGYIITNGDTVDVTDVKSSSAWRHAVVPVEQGDVFVINATGGAQAEAYVLLNGNNVVTHASSTNIEDKVITINNPNITSIVINDKSLSGSCFKGNTISNRANALENGLNQTSENVVFLNESVEYITGNDVLKLSPGYIITSGSTIDLDNVNPNQNYYHCIYPCSVGDVFELNGEGAGSALLWAFVASDGETRLTHADGNAVAEKLLVEAPTNAAYIVINVKASSANRTCSKNKVLKETVDELYNRLLPTVELDVNNIGDYLDGKTEATFGAWQNGMVLLGNAYPVGTQLSFTEYNTTTNPSGSINSKVTTCRYQIIDCTPGETYNITSTIRKPDDSGNLSTRMYAFVDSDNVILSKSETTTIYLYGKDIVVPEDAAKLIVNCTKYNTDEENAAYSVIKKAIVGEKAITKKHLSVLVFGNSYSGDCWQYVPFILKNFGITCEVYISYRGNGSIYALVKQWEDTGPDGEDWSGALHTRTCYHIDTRTMSEWEILRPDPTNDSLRYSSKQVLEFANDPDKHIKWDLITLQTAPTEVYFVTQRDDRVDPNNIPVQIFTGTDVDYPDPRMGYEPYIRQAITLIQKSYSLPFTLGWFAAYTRIASYKRTGKYYRGYINGYDFDNRVGAIKAAETAYHAEPFDMVIPAATAVFNARTDYSLASTDISALGNLWYSDGVHLQHGVPCYIGALSIIQSLFKQFYPTLSVMNDKTRISQNWINNHVQLGNYHGTVKVPNSVVPSGLSPAEITVFKNAYIQPERYYRLAQKAAVSAVEHPFEITPIYDTEQADGSFIPYDDAAKLSGFYSDEQNPRYWADSLIDTTNIDPDNLTDYDDGSDG